LEHTLPVLTELPHGPGCDRTEAFCELPPGLTGSTPAWLVLYDALDKQRRDGDVAVYGDLLQRR
jgi:hypothetical protein